MAEVNIINVEVTPQAPINVETQTKSVNVQVGNDAALGAVTQGVIDLHKKVDDLANKQVDVDLTPVAKESTLTSAKEEIIEAVNSAQVEIDTSNLASKNLDDFFGVVADTSEEAITDEEITQELEDIFNTIFN